MNIYEQIILENSSYSGSAVIENGRTHSYPDLFRAVDSAAEILRENGVSFGVNCGFIADDSYDYIVWSLAILKLNASVIPLSTRSPENEIQSMIRSLPMDVVVGEEKYVKEYDRSLSGIMVMKNIRRDHEAISLPDGNVPAFIRFSSGTTGKNKGVILSHRTVLERTSACRMLDIRRGEKVLWVLDMAFHYVVTILLFLRRGAVIVICGQPVDLSMIENLSRYDIKLLYATPYHYQNLTVSELCRPEYLSSVKCAVSTAMKLPADIAEAFMKKFKFPLRQAYGIIEIGLPCINSSDLPDKVSSAGQVQAAYQIKIDHADGNGVGEILIKGPGMFDAYWSPFQLRQEVCRDGYFVTGDVGRLDESGFLFILGRTKNLINFAGMKIFPYEVEDLLRKNPLVKDVLVYPVRESVLGEIPAAKIVLQDGIAPSGLITKEIRKYCYSVMAEYKVPKIIDFVSDLPKTASGKVSRK